MRIDSHRPSLLTAKEIDDLYGLPHFTEADRHHYFTLSVPERAAVEAHTTAVAVHLTLQLGYFKAKWQFFSYEQDAVSDDLCYILDRYFPGKAFTDLQRPSRPTRFALQHIVLQLFDYHLYDRAAKDELERKAQRNARLSTQPLYLLREALQHLTTQRIVAPPYTFLQDMVGRVVTRERTRITRLLGQALTPTVATQLNALLEADEHMYRISALKREAKDFSYNSILKFFVLDVLPN